MVGNLIDNAIEAVAHCAEKKIDVDFDYGDDILTVEVQDTGTGMSDERQTEIFQKGFSTKGENRGWGLHLISQAIKRVEGELMITSQPGKGTVFTIYIPYTAEGEEI
jgi:two-component system, CitB family, sensor histidine kinase MalK